MSLKAITHFSISLIMFQTFHTPINANDGTSDSPASAVTQTEAQTAQASFAEAAKFFSGEWSNAGEFSGGRKIEADATFIPNIKIIF